MRDSEARKESDEWTPQYMSCKKGTEQAISTKDPSRGDGGRRKREGGTDVADSEQRKATEEAKPEDDVARELVLLDHRNTANHDERNLPHLQDEQVRSKVVKMRVGQRRGEE